MTDLNNNTALSLGEIVEGVEGRVFHIPLYQRTYKWKEENAKKLAEDLHEAYDKGENKSIGLITLYQHNKTDNEYDVYDVIDGQQRFITLSILLNVLHSGTTIDLIFDRDCGESPRKNALSADSTDGSTDTDRIKRNKDAIKKALGKKIDLSDPCVCDKFATFILNNCVMLCSVMENPPIDEFMNLNAYKTKFSVCDYVRANLITLNTFFRQDLERDIDEVSAALSENTYKTAVAKLYNDILEELQDGGVLPSDEQQRNSDASQKAQNGGAKFSDPYKVLVKNFNKLPDPDRSQESRINALFCLEKKQGHSDDYRFDPGNLRADEWIRMLKRLAHSKAMIHQLGQEIRKGDYGDARAIDNYHEIKRKPFLELLAGLWKPEGENGGRELSLSALLQRYSNVSDVLLGNIGHDKNDLKLANRYFEAFAYYNQNNSTDNDADAGDDSSPLSRTEDGTITQIIRNTGRYMIDRFLTERQRSRNARLTVPPIVDLNDTENEGLSKEAVNSGLLPSQMSVAQLFGLEGVTLTDGTAITISQIRIPVIQRDYCMGMQIGAGNEENFLSYLVKNFEEQQSKEEPQPLIASTILLARAEQILYIFDGQQRTFTIYSLLKMLSEGGSEYIFVGRKEYEQGTGSPYSEQAVKALKEAYGRCEKEKLNDDEKRNNFKDYLKNHVKFVVKEAGDVSAAEQFFMDINGGVELQTYEIFKACLFKRLQEICDCFAKGFVLRLENEWLNAIYTLLKIQKSDDSDKEELVEMRLVEYLCRFFYRHREGKTKEDAPSFDTKNSKSDLVAGATAYLSKLEKEDFENVRKCMDAITTYLKQENPREKPSEFCRMHRTNFKRGSNILEGSVSGVSFGYESDFAKYLPLIFRRFTESLAEDKREMLLKYYSCDAPWLLKNIYDRDDVIKYAIHKTIPSEGVDCNALKKYSNYCGSAQFFGGYQVGIIEYIKGECRDWPIYEEEAPAYYSDYDEYDEYRWKSCVVERADYLARHSGEKIDPHKFVTLSFFFVRGKGEHKRPNGSKSEFLRTSKFLRTNEPFDGDTSNNDKKAYFVGDGSCCHLNQRDAYAFNSNDSLAFLKWKPDA